MIYSKISRLVYVLLSGDVVWLKHRLRLFLGRRGQVPMPQPLVSMHAVCDGVARTEGNRAKKILVFSHNLDREGASISLKELACGLKSKLGISVEVIAFGDGPLRAEYQAEGIHVDVIPSLLPRISTIKRLNSEVGILAQRINDSSPDVVFVNTLLNFPAVLAAEVAGLPSVWNPRESEPWDSYFRFLPDPVAQQAIAAIGLPRRVVFVADATREVWKGFEGAASFSVIHNALNTVRFSTDIDANKALLRSQLGWSDDEIVFLSVGTLCERKGQMDLLQAMESVAGKLNSCVRVVFVGDGRRAYARALRVKARQLFSSVKIKVDFVESTTAVGLYYRAADVFVLSSRLESYPRVILEALAFGLPIISTPVFGVMEQIPNPTDARFYNPGDIPELADHVLSLANVSAIRHDLAQRSHARFSQMKSYDEMLESYAEIINEVGLNRVS